jgi:hypothetical protein
MYDTLRVCVWFAERKDIVHKRRASYRHKRSVHAQGLSDDVLKVGQGIEFFHIRVVSRYCHEFFAELALGGLVLGEGEQGPRNGGTSAE